MYTGPHDPRYSDGPTEISWRSLAGCYALMTATLLLLWTATNPFAGAAVVAGTIALAVGTRKTVPLLRCLADCGGFVLDVTENLQVCVVRPAADGPC